jgi:hypothetical protein
MNPLLFLLVIPLAILIQELWLYLGNPTIHVRPSTMSMPKCPNQWNYSGGLCLPTYSTSCRAFNPDASTLSSVNAKCNVARSCGTSWGNVC